MNKNNSRGQVAAVWAIICLFLTALIIKAPDIPIKYIGDSLKLCAFGIIPTLFPFSVMSELLIKSGGSEWLGGMLDGITHRIFGLPGECGTAILLGSLCGAPVGTSAAMTLYERGVINKRETERLIPLCTYPSAAFTLGSIGASMHNCTSLGLCIHTSVLASGLIIGVISTVWEKYRSRRRAMTTVDDGRRHSKKDTGENNKKSALKASECGIELIPTAIYSAAEACIRICAVILFFSCILGCVDRILSSIDISDTLTAAVLSFFELTFGASAAAVLDNTHTGILLTAAASAWMGLSIHLQVFAITAATSLPRPRLYGYFAAKAIGAPLSATFVHIFCRIPALSEAADISATLLRFTVYDASYEISTIGACLSAVVILLFAAFRIKHVFFNKNKPKNRL